MSDADLVPVLKSALTNGNIIYVRSVSAIQIAECGLFVMSCDYTVLPRNSAVRREAESVGRLAPYDELAFWKREHSAFEWAGDGNHSRAHMINLP